VISTTFRVALAIFLVLYGLFAVTNIEVAWGRPLAGFAALCAGVLLVILLVAESRSSSPPP